MVKYSFMITQRHKATVETWKKYIGYGQGGKENRAKLCILRSSVAFFLTWFLSRCWRTLNLDKMRKKRGIISPTPGLKGTLFFSFCIEFLPKISFDYRGVLFFSLESKIVLKVTSHGSQETSVVLTINFLGQRSLEKLHYILKSLTWLKKVPSWIKMRHMTVGICRSPLLLNFASVGIFFTFMDFHRPDVFLFLLLFCFITANVRPPRVRLLNSKTQSDGHL